MKRRILRFEGGNSRHGHYRNLIDGALQSRGAKSSDQNYKPSDAERRAEARLISQLQALSVVDEDALEKVNAARAKEGHPPLEPPDDTLLRDVRPQKLSPDGGTITVPQTPDFAWLVQCVKETPFQSQLSPILVDLEDWLDQAEKLDEDDAKPEPLKAVGGSRRGRTTG